MLPKQSHGRPHAQYCAAATITLLDAQYCCKLMVSATARSVFLTIRRVIIYDLYSADDFVPTCTLTRPKQFPPVQFPDAFGSSATESVENSNINRRIGCYKYISCSVFPYALLEPKQALNCSPRVRFGAQSEAHHIEGSNISL